MSAELLATGASGPSEDPAGQLGQLWRQGQRPDVDAFLAQAGPLSPEQLAAVLRVDQRERWLAGAPVSVENYLQRYPSLRAHADTLVGLVYNEFLLRERLGDRPSVEEYRRRFPEYAGFLQAQVELHRALAAALPSTQPQAPAAPAGLPAVAGYDVLRELGRGGMGVVYLARHRALKRLVALKMILAGPYADPERQARFRAEAEVVARLQHPHIVQIYEIGEQDGRPFLALEYVDGGSLEKHLAGTPQPARAAAQLVETLARAMHAAHQRGVLHRDLKPANILLAVVSGQSSVVRENKQAPASLRTTDHWSLTTVPKITDFGLAKQLDAGAIHTPSGAIVGTPSYMAPEQAVGQVRALGPAADVYALGAILYELLTGRPPFTGETPLDTLSQVVGAEPVPPRRLQPKVPVDVETIGLKCLQKEPAKRYPDAEALAEDLRRFQAGEPIRARPVGPVERLGRWCRRQPALASLTATLGLVLVGGFALVTALWLRAERLRQEARADFQLARESVDNYATRVSDNLRLRQEDLRLLRKELLESVVPFYEKLIQRHAGKEEVQAERARAYQRLARLTEEIDDKQQACERYEQAVALFDRLQQEQPAVPDYKKELADSRNHLAKLYRMTGRIPQAEAEHQKAQELWEVLAGQHPNEPAYQYGLAACHNEQGNLYIFTGRTAQAEAAFQKAVQLKEPLARQHPTVAEYQKSLAGSRNNLGNIYLETGRFAAAEAEYREALAIQEALARQRPEVPEQEQLRALLRNNLARVYFRSKRVPQALDEFHKALEFQEALARRHPSVTEHQRELARSHHNLGKIYAETGRLTEAEAAYRKALAIQETLTRDHPTVWEYQRELGIYYYSLGRLYFQTGRLAEAEAEGDKALAIHETFAHQHPADKTYPEVLAEIHGLLAAVYAQTGRAPLAEKSSQQELALWEQLARHHPTISRYAEHLGASAYNTARRLRLSGQVQASLARYAQALATVEAVLQRDPENALAKKVRFAAHWDRASALSSLGQHAQALADWDRALALSDGSSDPLIRADRAMGWARQGNHAQAVTEAQGLAQGESVSGATLRRLARAYALASLAARQDAKLSSADQDQLAEQYAAGAVGLLRQAAATGYFKGGANVAEISKDKDLESLRARADYAKLLQELETKGTQKAK